MSDIPPVVKRDAWVETVEAATILGCHPATLANWRWQKRGPPYERRRMDGKVRIVYRRDRLMAWARKEMGWILKSLQRPEV